MTNGNISLVSILHKKMRLIICAISLSLLFTLFSCNTKSIIRPNIIVILTDDHGYPDLNTQGILNDIKTPHIDALAATGVRMTSGYVTAPQCIPSRAGLLSGKYQQKFGVDDNSTIPFPLNEKMISSRMKEAGYVTGMAGKWHLEPNHYQREWIAANIPSTSQKKEGQKAFIPFEKKRPFFATDKGFQFVMQGAMNHYWSNHNMKGDSIKNQTIKIPGYRLDIQTNAALTFIEKYKEDPFFFFLSYYGPHLPLDATTERISRFPDEMPNRRRMCLAMLAAIDDGVGKIKERLQNLGIDENTLIIFLGDNGAPLGIYKKDAPISDGKAPWNGSLNDPYIGEKGMLSEAGIRVPFIMNWPKSLPKGLVYDRPVNALDIAATSLALAGEDVPTELDGVNLIPHLNGKKSDDPHDALYWRFWQQAAIRVGDWKYLKHAEQEFLFNVNSDKHEHANLYSEYPEKALELKSKLSTWSNKMKTPGLSFEGSREARNWLNHYYYESIGGNEGDIRN